MPNMLTKEDLAAIGQIVGEKMDEKLNDPQGVLNIKLDAVQEQIDSIENRMLTKSDLERWEFGLTGRYDQRYVRR